MQAMPSRSFQTVRSPSGVDVSVHGTGIFIFRARFFSGFVRFSGLSGRRYAEGGNEVGRKISPFCSRSSKNVFERSRTLSPR